MIKTLDPRTFQADRHTDFWIAQRVMLWPIMGDFGPFKKYLSHGGVIVMDRPMIFRFGTIPEAFMPSSKIEDALMVLRKMVDLGWVYVIHGMPSDKNILVVFTKEGDEYHGTAETESLAICRAAGLAVTGEK